MPRVLDLKQDFFSATTALQRKEKMFSRTKKFDLVYVVMGDNVGIDNEETILSAPGIPQLFYPLRGCFCQSRTPSEVSRICHPVTGALAGLWEVKCEFSSDIDMEADRPPEAKLPRVRWTGETEDVPLDVDAVSGRPVQTSAGEPIIATTPTLMPVLEITRYEKYPFNPEVMLEYANHTNTTPFWGASKGTALMLPMEVEDEIIEGKKYNNVKYRIKFKLSQTLNPLSNSMVWNEYTWRFRPMDRGYLYVPEEGSEPQLNLDAQRNPAPVNLDGKTGRKLEEGEDPEYLEFNRFPETDFNRLSLGPF